MAMIKQAFYTPNPSLRKYVRYFWSFDFDNLSDASSKLRIMADRFPKIIIQNMGGKSGIKIIEDTLLPVSFLSGIITKPLTYTITVLTFWGLFVSRCFKTFF